MKTELRQLNEPCIVLWWSTSRVETYWTMHPFVTLCGREGAVFGTKGGFDLVLRIGGMAKLGVRYQVDTEIESSKVIPGIWEPGTPDRTFGLTPVGECYTGRRPYISLVPVKLAKCAKCLINLDAGMEQNLIRFPAEGGPYRVNRGKASQQKPKAAWWNSSGIFVGPPATTRRNRREEKLKAEIRRAQERRRQKFEDDGGNGV